MTRATTTLTRADTVRALADHPCAQEAAGDDQRIGPPCALGPLAQEAQHAEHAKEHQRGLQPRPPRRGDPRQAGAAMRALRLSQGMRGAGPQPVVRYRATTTRAACALTHKAP